MGAGRAPWRMIRHRVGRRGAFLGFLAILDCAYAYSLWSVHLPAHMSLILPPRVWAVAWLVASAFCSVGVFLRRDRVPYTVAALMKTVWAALFFYLWYERRFPNAWVDAAVWLTFALSVVMVSSWPDPVFSGYVKGDRGEI